MDGWLMDCYGVGLAGAVSPAVGVPGPSSTTSTVMM